MQQITWLFRKKRALGNFSIEQSFQEVAKAWSEETKPVWTEATQFSQGWLNRWNIIRQTRALETDILHITGDIHFAALAWPKWQRNRPKVVLTIHDIGFIHDHTGWKRWLMKKVWITWPLRCVDQLITVSEATKEDVLKEASWFDPQKITVIPTVVPQHFKPRNTDPHNPKPIALHIGVAENKNLRRHAEALRGLDVHLRIIGEPSDADHRMLKQFGVEYSTGSKLTDAEMQEAYATSDFLLFASTLEGFGMPILEAQMVGLPVITSHIAPMNEVAGDGALLCDPFDVSNIRIGILKVLNNPDERKALGAIGWKNQLRFKPINAANMHWELYTQVKILSSN
jgi:glycosyltransferase involved in cell wall biosynthesis